MFAEVGQLNSTASNELSYDTLRDFFLPVTSTARQNAAAQGFPLTGFKQIRDQVLTPGQGVHGVRETFDYTYTGGITDTFDQVALTNADRPTCTSSWCTANQLLQQGPDRNQRRDVVLYGQEPMMSEAPAATPAKDCAARRAGRWTPTGRPASPSGSGTG